MIKNTLNNKQKKYLRSLGMTIEPVVQIGKEGVTPNVVTSSDEAITKRELIKIKVLQNAPCLISEGIEMVAERLNADLVQIIGRNGLLFRRNFKKPIIDLKNIK